MTRIIAGVVSRDGNLILVEPFPVPVQYPSGPGLSTPGAVSIDSEGRSCGKRYGHEALKRNPPQPKLAEEVRAIRDEDLGKAFVLVLPDWEGVSAYLRLPVESEKEAILIARELGLQSSTNRGVNLFGWANYEAGKFNQASKTTK